MTDSTNGGPTTGPRPLALNRNAVALTADPQLLDRACSYTAGILDGEGTISVHRRPEKIHRAPVLQIRVVNTNPLLAQWLVHWWGGSVSLRRSKNPRHKDVYQWGLWSRQAEALLRLCAPSMVIKGEQAALALAIRDLVVSRNQAPSDAAIIKMAALNADLKVLNARGRCA